MSEAALEAALQAVHKFQAECYALMVVSLTIIGVRLFVRIHILGWKGLQGDDWLALAGAFAVTGEMVAGIEIAAAGGTSFRMTDEARWALSEESVKKLELGQKWFMVGCVFYILSVWMMKSSMLVLCYRITRGLNRDTLIRCTGALVVMSFIGTQINLFANCRPWHEFFQVRPQPIARCQGTSPEYYFPTLVFNIMTDLLIMWIPTPLLLKAKMPLNKKIMLTALFCGGFFIIAAAITRCVLSFNSSNQSLQTAAWSLRETTVAVAVSNAAVIRGIFGNAKSANSKYASPGSGSGGGSHGVGGSVELSSHSRSNSRHLKSKKDKLITDSDSTDRIVDATDMVYPNHHSNTTVNTGDQELGNTAEPPHGHIRKHMTYEVTSSPV
ncbi:hypothetical protein RUND412_007995 [Rhizina undulata]